MITQDERRSIESIYENHAQQWSKWQNKLNYASTKALICGFLLFMVVGIVLAVADPLFLIPYFILGWMLMMYVMVALDKVYTKKAKEEFKRAGLKKENNTDVFDYHKTPWKEEAYFTIKYLEHLPMKSKVDEDRFRGFLYCRFAGSNQIRKSKLKKLAKIFRRVKERAESKEISDECKVDLTPWEFFRKYFFNRLNKPWSEAYNKKLYEITI